MNDSTSNYVARWNDVSVASKYQSARFLIDFE